MNEIAYGVGEVTDEKVVFSFSTEGMHKPITNGDVIKAMFPNCEIYEHKVKTNSQGDIGVGYDVFLYAYHSAKSDTKLGFGIKVFFDNMWWNAPYKRETE